MRRLIFAASWPVWGMACHSPSLDSPAEIGGEQELTSGQVVLVLDSLSLKGEEYSLNVGYVSLFSRSDTLIFDTEYEDSLEAHLQSGSWLLEIDIRWSLEKKSADGYRPIAAQMLTDNPQRIQLKPHERHPVLLRFQTEDGVVSFEPEEEVAWEEEEKSEAKMSTVSAGYMHSCGINLEGELQCWGIATEGYLDGGQVRYLPPGQFISLSSGGMYHSCAIDTEASIHCWGTDGWGQVSQVPSGSFLQVAAGDFHGCAIDQSKHLHCWGYNGYGQSHPPTGEFVKVAAGTRHSCGIDLFGSIRCWGDNSDGQSTPPQGVFTEISLGNSHGCAIDTEGLVQCWGLDHQGQVGEAPKFRMVQISLGDNHGCGIQPQGKVQCWGYNGYGQNDPPNERFRRIAAGGSHSCGVAFDGKVHCWGANGVGQSHPTASIGE
jgi:alpha-tubulin suppressor-like RCC1 family protein